MNLITVSFDNNELNQLKEQINKVKELLLIEDSSYFKDLETQQLYYKKLKNYFIIILKYLKFENDLLRNKFYRVRKCRNEVPHINIQYLTYPKISTSPRRMNNASFPVLYVSFDIKTAINESKLKHNENFQITIFESRKSLKVFFLGGFSKLLHQYSINSEETQVEINRLFKKEMSIKVVEQLANLENEISNILYSNEQNYHLLSSVIADALFTLNQNIDAIMYPSLRNRNGMNLAIKGEIADTLTVTESSFNKLDENVNNTYRYTQEMKCIDFSNKNNLIFSDDMKNIFID